MKFIGIIPARYASSRFPGKPLADMDGKPMIQRVYEQVIQAVDDVCVATDDERIEAAVKAFGGKVVNYKLFSYNSLNLFKIRLIIFSKFNLLFKCICCI